MRTRLCTIALILASLSPAAARAALPAGFVYLRDVAPGIAQDMRYATADNFTGHPLPGYDAGECVLRREVALALQKVQADLARENMGLKVYDCYRPTRAVTAFVRWAKDGAHATPTKRFFPALEKRMLFTQGYIAAQSAHSTGTAIDLTLIHLPAAASVEYDPTARYGACTGAANARAPDNSLDMGTGFDCFDSKSHTASPAITNDQKFSRAALNNSMRLHGFKNYFREWWHFTFGSARGMQLYNFPIKPG
jgi:zinc D-Ala-D-Ala dipeptidase